jgi:splicing factor 4
MELYMRRAADAERARAPTFAAADAIDAPDEPRLGEDTRFRSDGSRAHHIADYIPPAELAALTARGGGGGDEGGGLAAARAAAEAAAAIRERLGADNKGHQLLSKMGWTEGAGLGAGGAGIVNPIAPVGNGGPHSTLGVGAGSGASGGGGAEGSGDIFEAYQKRMALGYKHRPNPLGNPRKAYY